MDTNDGHGKMAVVDGRMVGPILSLGVLYKLGKFWKRWRARTFMLTPQTLYYFVKWPSPRSRGKIPLSHILTVTKDTRRGRVCMCVETTKRLYYLSPSPVKDVDQWIQSLYHASHAFRREVATTGAQLLTLAASSTSTREQRNATISRVRDYDTAAADELAKLDRARTAEAARACMDALAVYVNGKTDGTQLADIRQAATTLAIAKHKELGKRWDKDVDASYKCMMAVLNGQIEAVEARLAERRAKPEVEHTLRSTMVATLAVGANSARDAKLPGGSWRGSGRSTGSETDDDWTEAASGAGAGAGAGAPVLASQARGGGVGTGGRGLNGAQPAATLPTAGKRPQNMAQQRAMLTQFSHSFHLGDTRNRTAVTLHSLYTLGRKIGSGAFAVVYEAVHKASGRKVAVKCVKKQCLSARDRRDLETEVRHLRRLRTHPNIVGIKAAFNGDPNYFYLVQELMTGGELFESIVKQSCYTEEKARNISRQLVDALAYMHRAGIIHRDLKPENVLLTDKSDNARVKIADFGLSVSVASSSEQSLLTGCGTPAYAAPEVLDGTGYGAPRDMWSMGIIIYIMLCGHPPFMSNYKDKLYAQIRSGQLPFDGPVWAKVSASAKDLITKLVEVDPSKRLTAEEALQHEWMATAHLPSKELPEAILELRRFNNLRRLRAAVNTIITTNRLGRTFSVSSKRMSSMHGSSPILVSGSPPPPSPPTLTRPATMSALDDMRSSDNGARQLSPPEVARAQSTPTAAAVTDGEAANGAAGEQHGLHGAGRRTPRRGTPRSNAQEAPDYLVVPVDSESEVSSSSDESDFGGDLSTPPRQRRRKNLARAAMASAAARAASGSSLVRHPDLAAAAKDLLDSSDSASDASRHPIAEAGGRVTPTSTSGASAGRTSRGSSGTHVTRVTPASLHRHGVSFDFFSGGRSPTVMDPMRLSPPARRPLTRSKTSPDMLAGPVRRPGRSPPTVRGVRKRFSANDAEQAHDLDAAAALGRADPAAMTAADGGDSDSSDDGRPRAASASLATRRLKRAVPAGVDTKRLPGANGERGSGEAGAGAAPARVAGGHARGFAPSRSGAFVHALPASPMMAPLSDPADGPGFPGRAPPSVPMPASAWRDNASAGSGATLSSAEPVSPVVVSRARGVAAAPLAAPLGAQVSSDSGASSDTGAAKRAPAAVPRRQVRVVVAHRDASSAPRQGSPLRMSPDAVSYSSDQSAANGGFSHSSSSNEFQVGVTRRLRGGVGSARGAAERSADATGRSTGSDSEASGER